MGTGWFAASCHTEEDLKKAVFLGVDFVTLSPVQHTVSHPGAVPLGWSEFARLTETVSVPVYGLGGLATSDVPESWERGAQGIAAIRGLWAGSVEVS